MTDSPVVAGPVPPVPSTQRIAAFSIEKTSKLLTASFGCLYVVGILTTNTYLFSLSVSEFSLLKARYIYTGAIVLIPIVVAVWAPAYGIYCLRFFRTPEFQAIQSTMTHPWSRALVTSRLFPIFHLLMCVGLPYVMFLFLFEWSGAIGWLLIHALWMYFMCGVIGLLGGIVVAAFVLNPSPDRIPKHLQGPFSRAAAAFGLTLFCVLYFALYLSSFTAEIITRIPVQFGGFAPKEMQFLFDASEIEGVQELGIKMEPGSRLSPPLEVLFETDSLYVVDLGVSDGLDRLLDRANATHRIVRLNKEIVLAVKTDG